MGLSAAPAHTGMNMTILNHAPEITVSAADLTKLLDLARSDAAEDLLAEIERARIVADAELAANVIRMGSTATFSLGNGPARTVTLVYPGEADIAKARISVLTPVGTALLGLSTGQTIAWIARDGREHELTVLAVTQA
jgi:regulator of nucleoside diphosphate kinase